MIVQTPSTEPLTRALDGADKQTRIHKDCEKFGEAIDEGRIGNIVAKHEKLILHYYKDVQDQAKQSFDAAIFVARIGFVVLIVTVFYALVCDALGRQKIWPDMASLTVAGIGVVSGALIEFIAAITFWLYARGAKQFNAFHICLE